MDTRTSARHIVQSEDVQTDFLLSYDCGEGLPKFPLIKKFKFDEENDIFEISPRFKDIQFDVAFLWDLATNTIETRCDADFAPTIDDEDFEKIKRFIKYQINNSGLFETLKSMAPPSEKRLFIRLVIPKLVYSIKFHSDKTIFTMLTLRNSTTPYVFGTELFMNSAKIAEERNVSFADGWMNGNCNVATNSLQRAVEKNPKSQVFRNIMLNNDTLMFANYLWAHSSPDNFRESDKIVSIEVSGKGKVENVPITICSHRKEMTEVDYRRDAIAMVFIPFDVYKDFSKYGEDASESKYTFTVSDIDNIPLDIPEILLSGNDGSAEEFFKILSVMKDETCIVFQDVELLSRGGKRQNIQPRLRTRKKKHHRNKRRYNHFSKRKRRKIKT
jgi:hypothetical protein